MSIKPLPGDVVAQIKSSVVVTSLNGVIIGLLQNSLDADATKVNVSVDYSKGNCSVEDNGQGILPDSFRPGGGLGQLHSTSKYPPDPERFGRHGAFLFSVATLSLLSVTSHHREYLSHNSMTIHNTKVVARNIPALPEQRLVASSSGTRVTVRDLFGSLPVRVKQRALDIERMGSVRDFDRLVRHVIALLLAWPGHASISLRDAGRKAVTLRTSDTPTPSTRLEQSRLLRTRTPSLLAQASLYDAGDSKAWIPVEVSAGDVRVAGCISLVPVATKQMQFILLGIQPLLNDHHSNVLYEEANRVFANSSFGVVDDAGPDEGKVRKGIDRWPVFCIKITRNGIVDVDDLFDRQQSGLGTILKLLRTVAYEFLKKHHFSPRSIDTAAFRSPRRKPVTAADATNSLQSRTRSPFAGSSDSSRLARHRLQSPANDSRPDSPRRPLSPDIWSIAKSGRPINLKLLGNRESRTPSPSPISPHFSGTASFSASREGTPFSNASSHKGPLFAGKSGKLARRPFDDDDTQSLAPATPSQASPPPKPTEQDAEGGPNSHNTIVWVDPVTKVRSLIDARTGFVTSDNKRKRLTLPPSRSPATTTDPVTKKPWLDDILHKWNNPVFESTESRVPSVRDARPCNHGPHACHGADLAFDVDNLTTIGVQERLSRQVLRQARVIAQVDRKFILVTVPRSSETLSTPDDTSLLVAIDQHAADERIRLEGSMQSYFVTHPTTGATTAATRAVDKPLRFDLPRREADLLLQYTKHFAYWGVFYEVFAGQGTNATVSVQSLPVSIFERCRLEPKLVVDVLRKEIWRLEERPGLAFSHSHTHSHTAACTQDETESEQHPHIALFSTCPTGIWDLLCSRSCRSAIMFNDELTIQQCRDLVKRLTECAFPFQCAHGRPSMLPLVGMKGWDGVLGGFGGAGKKRHRGEGEGGGKGALWRKLCAMPGRDAAWNSMNKPH